MSIAAFASAMEANAKSLVKGVSELSCLWSLPKLKLYPHQEATALRVLSSMGGRAILADEVGLGKTIEAGVILKELMVRGMAKRALVLVPASLVTQWKSELYEKLDIDAAIGASGTSWSEDVVLASLDTAKRPENAAIIWSQGYDVLIVDEAHKLKSHATLNWHFVSRIRKRFLLLLTATPVQNELKELYNMVTLLRPGQLSTYTTFKREFMLDRRTPKNAGELRALLEPVLVRHTRRETGITFANRTVTGVSTRLSGAATEFYKLAMAFARRNYRSMSKAQREGLSKSNVLPLILLLRESCSSVDAAAKTALTMLAASRKAAVEGLPPPYAEVDLLESMAALAENEGMAHEDAKMASAISLVERWALEKVLIFTEFVETARRLEKAMAKMGLDVVVFSGGLGTREKASVIDRFRLSARVMVSTEAGSEGHNLQFCRNVINFDLPWNPMRVEQRIGRVHRLGQEMDVRVANLFAEGTVEAYVLYLLDKKIRMFESIVGELDLILSGLGKRTFEGRFADLVLSSRDDDDLAIMVEALGDQLDEARMAYERTKRMNSLVLG